MQAKQKKNKKNLRLGIAFTQELEYNELRKRKQATLWSLRKGKKEGCKCSKKTNLRPK